MASVTAITVSRLFDFPSRVSPVPCGIFFTFLFILFIFFFDKNRQRNSEAPEAAASILELRHEVGAMRREISARLDQVSISISGLERRLLDIESSFMTRLNARLDNLLEGVTTTRLDIQGLSLDFDQGHDRVFSGLNHVRGAVFDVVHESQKQISRRIDGLSKTLTESNDRARDGFLEIGRGLDVNHTAIVDKLDMVPKDISSIICDKIDNANGNVNQNIMESRDDVCARISQAQEEVERSRRRINEKINSMHEATAGLVNTTRDRVMHKVGRTAAILGSILPVVREIRKSCQSTVSKEVGFQDLVGDTAHLDTNVEGETSRRKKRLESILKFPKY